MTRGRTVRLFWPDGNLRQSVKYQGAPQGQSYALDQNGNWRFTVPTPGAENIFDVPLAEVALSEVLPNPAGDDEEFVEFYNASSTDIDLSGFKLLIGTHRKIFDNVLLASSSFLTLF